MGVPVISSNTGGIPEVNVQGVTGYLSNVGDVEDMAKNAVHILSDKDRLKTFRENAIKHAGTFNVEAIVSQYEAIYDKLLEEK